jgi:hypothetical protein
MKNAPLVFIAFLGLAIVGQNCRAATAWRDSDEDLIRDSKLLQEAIENPPEKIFGPEKHMAWLCKKKAKICAEALTSSRHHENNEIRCLMTAGILYATYRWSHDLITLEKLPTQERTQLYTGLKQHLALGLVPFSLAAAFYLKQSAKLASVARSAWPKSHLIHRNPNESIGAIAYNKEHDALGNAMAKAGLLQLACATAFYIGGKVARTRCLEKLRKKKRGDNPTHIKAGLFASHMVLPAAVIPLGVKALGNCSDWVRLNCGIH